MKYKSIEKIPYLTLPACSRRKDVKYICVTDIIEVQKEKHLILEIYQNKKTAREIPVARVVLAERDHSTYLPEKASWSGKRLIGNSWGDGGILRDIKPEYSRSCLGRNFILSSQKDRERIETYCQGITVWKKENWWDFIDKKQEQIRTDRNYERWKRRSERKQQALQERAEDTPELPEQRILQYAEDVLFSHKHYLYYKKHGSRVQIACSACGMTADRRWKAGASYESQFGLIEEPRHGCYGNCPICGAAVEYFAAGKAKTCEVERKYLFLGQRYKERGMVIRYIDVEKEWNLELCPITDGIMMQKAHERIDGIEIARAYFEPGKKLQIDYHKHSYYSGKDFWDDCNLAGNANIIIREAAVMPETWAEMKGTFLQYSALKEFQEVEGNVNVVDYLKCYTRTPQLEMLVKMHMYQIVRRMERGNYGMLADENADRMDQFLGIRKERIKMLADAGGNIELLNAMQQEKAVRMIWTEEQIRKLAELETGSRMIDIGPALQYMTMQKLLNRIEKYAGCGYGVKCSEAEEKLRQTARTYLDYLGMREELGYDLNNSVYQYPKDLREAHDKMMLEKNKEEINKRAQEAEEKFPNIRKQYRKLRKRYCYQDNTYMVRPARSAGEIVMEGRILHHCVGGDNYLGKHDRGTSYILMLRFRERPEEPYITIEVNSRTDRIVQWYGSYDRKPDREHMQEWIDRYTAWLEAGRQDARAEVETRIRATA